MDDLDELVEDELSMQFARAASHLQSIASNLDNTVLLTLYAYYKQGSEGPCETPKPSWYDMRGKAKWEAWNNLRDMPPNEAKAQYIELLKNIDPDFTDDSKPTKETWVTVSTLQSNNDNQQDSEKNLIDHIKEGNFVCVLESLGEYTADELSGHINALDEAGLGLIHWASDRGSVEILKLLISHGANINLRDSEGQTPLHYAASCGHIECVEHLLENGADATVKDSDGIDCFEAAGDDCVKTLLDNYKVPKV